MSDKIVVNVTFNKETASLELPSGSNVEDILRSMKLYPDAHIVLRGKTPVPITEKLKGSEEFRIIKVASGG
jgi:sulfur carrier protein ThiS